MRVILVVDRVKSGVPGFDELVNGGIPKRNIVLLSGGPGTADLLSALKDEGSPPPRAGRFGLHPGLLPGLASRPVLGALPLPRLVRGSGLWLFSLRVC